MSLPEFVTIVSGLPRSGTSMMMRMLEAGGIHPVCDGIRVADDDNTEGYYEFERVKKIKEDKTWLPETQGKAVKMIYRLLYDLPDGFEYRVLFMRRELDEVIASQNKMLARHGRIGPDHPDDAVVKSLFQQELKRFANWLPTRPYVKLLDVDYNHLVRDPVGQVAVIEQFLGRGLNQEAMCAVVNPALYRNRKTG